MSKKVNIIMVEEIGNKVNVTYETGTIKAYPADKLPKTVIAWIEKQIEEVPAEHAKALVKSARQEETKEESAQEIKTEEPEQETGKNQEEREGTMKKQEVATIETVQMIPTAAETNTIASGLMDFGFILLTGLALGAMAFIGLASVLFEGIITLFCILKSHRNDIKSGIQNRFFTVKKAVENVAKQVGKALNIARNTAGKAIIIWHRMIKKAQEIGDEMIIKSFDLIAKIPSINGRKAVNLTSIMTGFVIGLTAILV